MSETNAYVRTPVAQVGAGTVVIVAAEVGKTVCIHEAKLSLSAEGTVTIEDSDGTDFGSWDLAALGQTPPLEYVGERTVARCLAAGKGLSITNSAGNMKGFVTYSQV